MRLETLVYQKYDQMSESERLVWNYIRQHRKDCRILSLKQLADACGVSHSSVLRFIQLLGMEGFAEFKMFLKWEDRQNPAMETHCVEKNGHDLNKTIQMIEKMDCTLLFEQMDRATQIYAYGTGSIQKSAAKTLKSFLMLDEKLVNIIEGREERAIAMLSMTPGNVAFLFSLSGNSAAINTYAKQLHGKGVYIVGIGQDGANRLAGVSDFYLPFVTQKMTIGQERFPYASAAGMFIIAETLALKYAAYLAERTG